MKDKTRNGDKEACACRRVSACKLMWAAAPSPVWCLGCERYVPLKRLALAQRLSAQLAQWSDEFANVYALWVGSASYEAWAARQLFDLASPLNRRGLALVADLAGTGDWYYWFDINRSDEVEPVQLEQCPSCGEGLEAVEGWSQAVLVCRNCQILTPMVIRAIDHRPLEQARR